MTPFTGYWRRSTHSGWLRVAQELLHGGSNCARRLCQGLPWIRLAQEGSRGRDGEAARIQAALDLGPFQRNGYWSTVARSGTPGRNAARHAVVALDVDKNFAVASA